MVASVCSVQFDGIEVGVLAQQSESSFTSFQYTKEWAAEGFSLSPIFMPLGQQVFTFPALPYETYKGLPAVFADSLPDDFGNALINNWLARQGIDRAAFSAIDRLLYTGTRGMGALEYQTALEVFDDVQDVQLFQLVGLAQEVLDQRSGLEVNASEDDAMINLLQVGTSAGGARPKAVIALNEDRSKILSGQVRVPEGFEHYLLKFDGVTERKLDSEVFGDPKGFGLMEYAYYRMAVDCGIEISHCELLKEGGRSHFITRRFDRENNQKYHVLSLCGMAHADFRQPGHYSYEELLAVCRTLNLPVSAQQQIFRRMVFNVISRNQDDHTKNFSFMVNDNFEWCLSPAYDVAWSYKPDSPWVSQHQLTLNGKRDNFTRDDLIAVASLIPRFSVRQANQIIDNTLAVAGRWTDYADETRVFPKLRDYIQSTLRLAL